MNGILFLLAIVILADGCGDPASNPSNAPRKSWLNWLYLPLAIAAFWGLPALLRWAYQS